MNTEAMEIKLDRLITSARSTSNVDSVVTITGILSIVTAMYLSMPSWSELKGKDVVYWWVKTLSAVIIIVCTVLLVRMLMNSKDVQDDLASNNIGQQDPLVKDILDNCRSQTGGAHAQLTKEESGGV